MCIRDRSDTLVQFNDSGSFGGDSDFTYNKTTNTLTVVNLTATNITTTGSGSQTISAGANIELNATNRVLVTDTPFRLASMTTTQRNAISSPVNGDMIYNSTTNQLESYENSAWGATGGSSSSYSNSDVDTHLNTGSASSGQILSWNGSDYAWVADQTGGGSSNSISQLNSNVTVTDTGTDGTITFDTEGTDRWQFTSAGHLVPVADTTYDIGSATNLVRDIYVSNSSIKFGSSAIPLTVSGSNRLNFNSNQLMENLVDDTTPQLGGTLDANGNTIDMGTNILTDTNLGQFITAYGWGDHSVPGYLTTADVYKQMIVTDTDSGFTYAETGTHTASGLTDTFTFVSGTGIDLDVDTTNGALRISRAGTGASFSQSSFTGDGSDTTFDTGNTNLVDVQVFVNGVDM